MCYYKNSVNTSFLRMHFLKYTFYLWSTCGAHAFAQQTRTHSKQIGQQLCRTCGKTAFSHILPSLYTLEKQKTLTIASNALLTPLPTHNPQKHTKITASKHHLSGVYKSQSLIHEACHDNDQKAIPISKDDGQTQLHLYGQRASNTIL